MNAAQIKQNHSELVETQSKGNYFEVNVCMYNYIYASGSKLERNFSISYSVLEMRSKYILWPSKHSECIGVRGSTYAGEVPHVC